MNIKQKHLAVITFAILMINPMIKAQTFVTFSTTYGDIRIRLYDETAQHKANMIKLVNQGFYDGVLFHRVIPSFMIQAGDPESKNASADQPLGSGGPGYTIPAEILPQYFHKKGALASARQGDQVNPARASSGSQFYIVQGQVLTPSQLQMFVESGRHKPFTPQQLEIYATIGGTPHLDDQYTVFGEVVEGIEVVDKIAAVSTDPRNRPLEEVKIIKATISE